MAYVQQCATGAKGKLSQKVLNELSAARVCLLHPDMKADYDRSLKANPAGPGLRRLPKTPPIRSSHNSVRAKFAELVFWVAGCIKRLREHEDCSGATCTASA
jgi:hypothetical protein